MVSIRVPQHEDDRRFLQLIEDRKFSEAAGMLRDHDREIDVEVMMPVDRGVKSTYTPVVGAIATVVRNIRATGSFNATADELMDLLSALAEKGYQAFRQVEAWPGAADFPEQHDQCVLAMQQMVAHLCRMEREGKRGQLAEIVDLTIRLGLTEQILAVIEPKLRLEGASYRAVPFREAFIERTRGQCATHVAESITTREGSGPQRRPKL